MQYNLSLNNGHCIEVVCFFFCILVFKQGDPGKSWYIILRGSVNVVVHGKGNVTTLGEGDDFGKLSLLNDCPRYTLTMIQGVFFLHVVARSILLLQNYRLHVVPLWNPVTRIGRTVIFQISALWMNSVNFCAWSKLRQYFVHMIYIIIKLTKI